MPAAQASRGLLQASGLPETRISPSSGVIDAGEDLDQRRLAGAVLADQRRHFARPQRETDIVQRAHAGKALGDARHRQDRRASAPMSCGAGVELSAAIGSDVSGSEERRAPAPVGAEEARADNQKILANFSMFDLSKVNGSAIAAEPSSPILMSPMRPTWIVVPGAPVALPSAIRAAIIVAV